MGDTKFTPGPWAWQGEDYRGDWGWQMLVGPKGEGLIVGQDGNGAPCRHLRSHMPVDPSLCQAGLIATGERVECVHVFSEANANLIKAAPDLYAVVEAIDALNKMGLWPQDSAMQGLANNARAALKRARGGA